jgi:hypothetical protein
MIDWKECLRKRTVKDVKEDINLINSLLKSSENKLKSANELNINEVTAASKLLLSYDSIRELLEAIALKSGFKIYNHECYTAFLKEILNESDKGDEFDEIRKVRNAINYYGKEISVNEAEKIIKRIKGLIAYFLHKLFK